MTAQEVLNGGFQTPPPDWTQPPTEGGDGGDGGLPPATDMCDGESTGPFPMPFDCSKCQIVEIGAGGRHQSGLECSVDHQQLFPFQAKFYNCIATGDGWEVQVDSCMDGLVFNPENGVCDWPDNVDADVCGDNGGGEGTDAPQPTTDAAPQPTTEPAPAPTTAGGDDGGEVELDCSVPGPAPYPDNCGKFYLVTSTESVSLAFFFQTCTTTASGKRW